MNKLIGAIVLMALLISACGGDKKLISKYSETEYVYYNDSPGPTVQVGEHVYFHMEITDDKDSLLQTTRTAKQMPSVKVAPDEDEVRKSNPLIDVIALLSNGDSVGVILPKDKIPGLPPQLDYIEHLVYKLAIKEVLTEEEFNQRRQDEVEAMAAKAEAMRERVPEIEALAKETLAAYNNGQLSTETTARGVKYVIHNDTGGAKAQNGQMVTVQYYGTLLDGTKFDASFGKGRGFSFRIGQPGAIEGWQDGIPEVTLGGSASLFIPADLGYGERGFPPTIGPGEDLYFYVELEEILN